MAAVKVEAGHVAGARIGSLGSLGALDGSMAEARGGLGEEHIAAEREPLDALAALAHVREQESNAPLASSPVLQHGQRRVVAWVVMEYDDRSGEAMDGRGLE